MVFKSLREDLQAFMDRDPAARSKLEVALCYPGFHAIVIYRFTHWLWGKRLFLLGRFLSAVTKWLTGVEIHPGATIGKGFVIDHGNGVVIGETAEIGRDVTLYQGVTLGGTSPAVDSQSQKCTKRHPTLRDNVIIGSGAQVLGPIILGEGARVGANAVVTKDVPPSTTVVGIPARVIMPQDREQAKAFVAYGTPSDGAPDPLLRTIEDLRSQILTLRDRVHELEDQQAASPTPGEDEAHIPVPLKRKTT
ncbi:MAG: serine O-acetyltransferase [Magnetovibrionaceae bacterium]